MRRRTICMILKELEYLKSLKINMILPKANVELTSEFVPKK